MEWVHILKNAFRNQNKSANCKPNLKIFHRVNQAPVRSRVMKKEVTNLAPPTILFIKFHRLTSPEE
jgi:hypothetical protein